MSIFKKCSCCGVPWLTRDEFLSDPNTQLVGYQVNFGNLRLGYLLFNHLTCESTIAVHAGLFRNLYEGPVFAHRLTGSEECPGYCGYRDNLQECNAKCECAYVRGILQTVHDWPKQDFQLAVAQGG